MASSFAPFRFSSGDVDEALDVGERVFYSHRLELARPRDHFGMELTAGRVSAMTIGHLQYRSEVVVECLDVTDSYAMCIPLHGAVEVTTPGAVAIATPERAALTGPMGSIGLRGWAVGQGPAILLKFERDTFEAELGRMLGHDVRGPVRLEPTLNLGSGRGLRWRRLVDLIGAELTDPQDLLWNPLMTQTLTTTVLTSLLLAANHSYRDELEGRAVPTSPATIRRAVAYMEEHVREPISMSGVAAAVGLSVRSMERGFRQHLSMSPRKYLERARLAMAHLDLVRESPATTSVARIASDWGFAHQGRFAALYRATYGRGPAEVLRAN